MEKLEQKRPSKSARILRGGLDAILALALVYVLYLIGSAALARAGSRTELRVLTAEARTLYDALGRYNERNHGYPTTHGESPFDLQTLDPLRKRGYYRGPLTSYLIDRRVDAYESPDDEGPNREFWIEMSLRSDPSIRILVARSNDAPLGGGMWREGVFVFRNGALAWP